jgi:hypothetical protein
MLDNLPMKNVFVRGRIKEKSILNWVQALTILFYFSQYILDWPLLKLSRIKGQFNFQDFVTIFTAADCFKTIGLQIYVPDPTTQLFCYYPYGRTFIYIIDLFRIPAFLAPGIIIIVGFLILNLTLKFLDTSTRVEKVIAFLFFTSPPFWLAFERGNVDLLICLLVLVAAYMATTNRIIGSVATLTLATLIKFYTFPLLLIVLWKNRKALSQFLSILLILTTAYIIFFDIQAQNLQQPGSFAFGTPIVTFWINAFSSNFNLPIEEVSIRLGHFIGLALLGVITAAFLLKDAVIMNLFRPKSASLIENCFFYLGTVYVSCFVLGMSYDYRLIFSALAGLFFMQATKTLGSYRWLLISIWALSVWLSVFSFGLSPKMHLLVQWIGNGFDFVTAGLIISLIIKQADIRVHRNGKRWRILYD